MASMMIGARYTFMRRLLSDPDGENAALGKLFAAHKLLHRVATACSVHNNTVRRSLICHGWERFEDRHRRADGVEWLLPRDDGMYLRPRLKDDGAFYWEVVDPATLPMAQPVEVAS